VINVRMQLSESIANHHRKYPTTSYIKEYDPLKVVVLALKSDKKDVSEPLYLISETDLVVAEGTSVSVDLQIHDSSV
jgi:hypothetical protein